MAFVSLWLNFRCVARRRVPWLCGGRRIWIVNAPGLPLISPTLPQPPPPRLTIVVEGEELVLQWSHPQLYQVMSVPDLNGIWTGIGIDPETSPENVHTLRIPKPVENTFFTLIK